MLASPELTALGLLADRLAGHGITMPHLDKLQQVQAWNLEAPQPPAGILDAAPGQVSRFTVEYLAFHAADGDVKLALNHVLSDQAAAELVTLVRAEADALIDQLRPAFDQAAAHARHVIELGVPPEADAVTFLDLPVEARDAWKEFRDVHSTTLDQVLATREQLSLALDLPPVRIEGYGKVAPSSINWGVTVTRPARGLPRPRRGLPHVRWLQVANDLHLNGLGAVGDLDYIRATGDTYVDDALSIARGRFEAGD